LVYVGYCSGSGVAGGARYCVYAKVGDGGCCYVGGVAVVCLGGFVVAVTFLTVGYGGVVPGVAVC
jgi:hypothetical protein